MSDQLINNIGLGFTGAFTFLAFAFTWHTLIDLRKARKQRLALEKAHAEIKQARTLSSDDLDRIEFQLTRLKQ